MFTDERRCNVWNRIRQQDLRVFGRILTPALMKEAAQAAGVKLGNSPLNQANLVWLGIAAALHTAKNFADILVLTFKLLEDADLWKPNAPSPKRKRRASKHNPHGKKGVLASEEAFVQARQRMSMDFWLWLLLLLAQRFQAQHPDAVRWKGFRLLAMDGTEIALPYWKTLAQAFGTSRNGRRRRRPQARMVMLAFPQCRLPWRYELTPRSCHEQTSAARLVEHLEPQDLLLMDRGFWSYGLFWQIQRRQAFFGIRLRRGVIAENVEKPWAGRSAGGMENAQNVAEKVCVENPARSAEIADVAGDPLSHGRLSSQRRGHQHARSEDRFPRGLGAHGDRRRGRPRFGSGLVPSPLGNRNDVLRVEGSPGNAAFVAQPHGGGRVVRGGGPRAFVLPHPLADFRGGGRAWRSAVANQLHASVARDQRYTSCVAAGRSAASASNSLCRDCCGE